MNQPKPGQQRILIAEDDPLSRRILESCLTQSGYDVIAVADGTLAWSVLSGEDSPRLAVLDWMMPGIDGVEICQKVRARKSDFYTYILLLSALAEKKDMLVGLRSGADDYLSKPFDADELQARLFVGERVLNLQDELIAARDALEFQATHDSLTGIPNRTAIMDTISRELARARREQTGLALILIDVDHFKQINDTHGHLTGDAVLRGVALRVSSVIRPYDSFGRYGGEEFLILAPCATGAGAMCLAERLRKGIESSTFETGSEKIRLTISLGVALSTADGVRDARTLVHAADMAMYRSKRSGKNQVQMATDADFEQMPVGAISAPAVR
jgi:diguanylate cyclase (GGDEF)-like protein